MTDETKPTGTPTETPQEKKPNMIESASAAADRLEAANRKMEENIAKLEELKASELLAGKTSPGADPEPPKEETAAEYYKKTMGLN